MASILGLHLTASSGNRFYDPGDAVTRGLDSEYPIYAEAKYTEHASFTLKLREVRQAHYRAEELGKRFVMPIRIWPKATTEDLAGPGDYALIPLSDLAELIDRMST